MNFYVLLNNTDILKQLLRRLHDDHETFVCMWQFRDNLSLFVEEFQKTNGKERFYKSWLGVYRKTTFRNLTTEGVGASL